MFKKDSYLNSFGYGNYKYIEDYNLFYNFYIAGYKFHNLKQVLVDVRLPKEGIRKTNLNYFKEEIYLQLKMHKNQYINPF